MKTLLNINMGDHLYSIYINDNLCLQHQMSPIHNHSYSEVHIIVSGNIKYDINNVEYELSCGNIMIIPAKMFHKITSIDKDANYITFQTDYKPDEYEISKLPDQVLDGFNEIAKKPQESRNLFELSSYILLALNYLLHQPATNLKRLSDYSVLIYDFFGLNYNKNITIDDLAKELHLSKKHTQRIIKEYTNNTFLQELTMRRMRTADYLIKNTDMSANAIAHYIGYSSYSGYWKARKKYLEAVKNSNTE